ncbi:MAG: CopG family transcriptional regulator [Actinobacteria bacterium]|nr:CopG family transcriptional regulator [Actinomycetota bacterium]
MKTVQRSFRISPRTLRLLDAAAAEGSESRNALVDRLLGEAVRTERHPLIRFHAGATGRRRPLVVGTRLYVHQVIATLRGHDGAIDAAAGYLDIDPRLVRAALAYYADHADEIDADAAEAEHVAADERARWERQRRALG